MPKKPKQYILEAADGLKRKDGSVGTIYLRGISDYPLPACHCVLSKNKAVRMSYRQAREMKARAGGRWTITPAEDE